MPLTPKPAPRKEAPCRPVDLGHLPPPPERNVYRQPWAVDTPSVEPHSADKGYAHETYTYMYVYIFQPYKR
jgi:hypothetical protein